MTKYTIAERQELKCKLADEKYFEKDLQLFAHLYPHHVLNDECKRVNKMNKAGLHSRMLYILLTRATEEEILANRGEVHSHKRSSEPAAAGIVNSLHEIAMECGNRVKSFLNIRKPDC